MMMIGKHRVRQRGFTIVELMIALSVLSVILVMATVILINIGALYSKGVNGANLQNAARNIVADVSANLQFSGTQPAACTLNLNATTCSDKLIPPTPLLLSTGVPVPIYTYCIGTTRYTYILNQELGTDQSTSPPVTIYHVLWRDTIGNGASCAAIIGLPSSFSTSAQAPTPVTNDGYVMVPAHMRLTRFKITQTTPGVYTVDVWMAYGDSDLVNTAADGSNTCKGSTGTQFCATSQITTAIMGRIY